VKLAGVVPASPSVTVTSLTITDGAGSSSRMVPTAWPSAITAPEAPDRLTRNVSFGSSRASPFTATVTGCVVLPGGNVATPDVLA
jgi:hypothetical protein